jgi:hypothetical protein
VVVHQANSHGHLRAHDYLKATNELHSNLTVTVLVNDKPAVTRKFDQASPRPN